VPGSGDPSSAENGNEQQTGIRRSAHARLRFGQGRPIGEVVNDLQKASRRDVFIQPDDGRIVVRGARGREHVIEPSGEHVTSVRRPDAAHQARLRGGTIRAATEEEFLNVKGFVQ
jgi:hypothetical protein